MVASLVDGYVMRLVARYGLSTNVPTLAVGEIGYDTDKKVLRVGDDTSTPPRVMTDKSLGSFNFASVTSITLPGDVVVADGKVDGVDISSLNVSDGLLVRRGSGNFATVAFVSGDETILITNPSGQISGEPIDIRLNPISSTVPDGDKGDITVTGSGTTWTIDAGVVSNAKMAPMSSAGLKGALAAGPVTDLTPAQVISLLPTFSSGSAGLVPNPSGVNGRILFDNGWGDPYSILNTRDSKDSVKCTSTANINMAGVPVPIDGVTLASSATPYRIGLAGQTNATENGIWSVLVTAGVWSWTRALDADANNEVTAGMFFWSSEGTDNSNAFWALRTDDPIIVGTTPLDFGKIGGSSVGPFPGPAYNDGRILNPSGGHLYGNASSIGGICITAPNARHSGVMISIRVRVSEYDNEVAADVDQVTLQIQAHWATDGTVKGLQAVQEDGSPSVPYYVSSGFDGVKNKIWIWKASALNLGGTWSYPRVDVTEVLYDNVATLPVNYAYGWNVAFVTSTGSDTVDASVLAQKLSDGPAMVPWSFRMRNTGSPGPAQDVRSIDLPDNTTPPLSTRDVMIFDRTTGQPEKTSLQNMFRAHIKIWRLKHTDHNGFWRIREGAAPVAYNTTWQALFPTSPPGVTPSTPPFNYYSNNVAYGWTAGPNTAIGSAWNIYYDSVVDGIVASLHFDGVTNNPGPGNDGPQ